MRALKPYLFQAYYSWIVDNGWTPYVLIDTRMPAVDVPQEYIQKDGHIVLNLAPEAVENFKQDNGALQFSASFGNVPCHLYVPLRAVEAVYAQENRKGIVFASDRDHEVDPDDAVYTAPQEPTSASPQRPTSPRAGPRLTLIQGDKNSHHESQDH